MQHGGRGNARLPILRMITRAVALGREYAISDFVGRLSNPQIQFLSLWNERAVESRTRTFSVIYPPFPNENGTFEYHLNILLDGLKPGH